MSESLEITCCHVTVCIFKCVCLVLSKKPMYKIYCGCFRGGGGGGGGGAAFLYVHPEQYNHETVYLSEVNSWFFL